MRPGGRGDTCARLDLVVITSTLFTASATISIVFTQGTPILNERCDMHANNEHHRYRQSLSSRAVVPRCEMAATARQRAACCTARAPDDDSPSSRRRGLIVSRLSQHESFRAPLESVSGLHSIIKHQWVEVDGA